jgi:putative ABC transport system substrate-binding protein
MALLAAPYAAEAQQSRRRPRVALLNAATPGKPEAAFREGLRALGYVDGANLIVDSRFAQGRADRLAALARELLDAKPDVVVTFGTTAAQAIKAATTTIPVVLALAGDPVEAGLVASLARPGGNITGLSLATPELAGKRVEFLKEVAPNLTRLSVLGDLTHSPRPIEVRHIEEVTRRFGVTVALIEFTRVEDLDRALREVAQSRPEALVVVNSSLTATNRPRIVAFAMRNRVPVVSSTAEWAVAGALLVYAGSLVDSCRQAAVYVDKILKGAKPGDLPVEEPTKFELVINLRTAKALGLTIPPSLLARADQVIE